MPIFRTLFLILAIWLAFKVAQALFRSHQRKTQQASTIHSQQLTVAVVPCAVCGVHIPKTEALGQSGRYFCSESHRKQLSGDG